MRPTLRLQPVNVHLLARVDRQMFKQIDIENRRKIVSSKVPLPKSLIVQVCWPSAEEAGSEDKEQEDQRKRE